MKDRVFRSIGVHGRCCSICQECRSDPFSLLKRADAFIAFALIMASNLKPSRAFLMARALEILENDYEITYDILPHSPSLTHR